MLDDTIRTACQTSIEQYQNKLDKDDIRSVGAWADYFDVDKRTIIKKIEEGRIVPATKNPYRISKYEILKIKG